MCELGKALSNLWPTYTNLRPMDVLSQLVVERPFVTFGGLSDSFSGLCGEIV